MTVVHAVAAHAQGGLTGQQSAQRDWSPYVVHFTNWKAMDYVRAALLHLEASPKETYGLLTEADAKSAGTAAASLASGHLRRGSPSGKDGIPECVCLSECKLPGLIGHAERYGRFGFVFQKVDIFRAGGRPCAYLDEEHYTMIAELGRGKPATTKEGRLFGLTNIYTPPGFGKIQDYTHEREWRIFDDVRLDAVPPIALLAPRTHLTTMKWHDVPVLPIDMLFDWGA